MHLRPASFTITREYSCFLTFGIVHFSLAIVFMMLICLVFLSALTRAWFKNGYWWLFILVPVAFFSIVLAAISFFKKKEDKKTLNRNLELYRALNEANDLFLKDSGIRLQGGDYGAWIEIVDESNTGKAPSDSRLT